MKRIPLTQGKFALVDDEDYDRVNQYKWYYNCGAAVRSLHPGRVYMACYIMSCPKGKITHHDNHNKLDNQKLNLIVCSHAENLRHQVKWQKPCSSKYRGLYWNKRTKKWRVRVNISGKNKHIGYFTNEDDAARAYNKAAIKYYKKFALLNEIK